VQYHRRSGACKKTCWVVCELHVGKAGTARWLMRELYVKEWSQRGLSGCDLLHARIAQV
jgi:hypothetical protein